jgi:DNA-binding Lrp family transcriptional regulator
VAQSLRPLAARLEQGLELVERPYEALDAPLALDEATVLATLSRWCADGTVRRFGAIVRHHEFGVSANAMTVFALPEEEVDDAGARLAAQTGVTLCYRRATTGEWPYNLYAMVHGRERAAVRERIDDITRAAGLDRVPREVLFSSRRFKQVGSRYFTVAPA